MDRLSGADVHLPVGKSGAANVGTNANTYTTVSGDAGNMITCVVTATNSAGNASATSAGVGPVTGTGTASNGTYIIYFF